MKTSAPRSKKHDELFQVAALRMRRRKGKPLATQKTIEVVIRSRGMEPSWESPWLRSSASRLAPRRPHTRSMMVAVPIPPPMHSVISDDQDWIIIEDRNDAPQTSCFFDRGTDVFMRFNITVVQP